MVCALCAALGDISPTGQLAGIRVDGDATVKLIINDADGRQLPTISIMYVEAANYPKCGALVLSDDGNYAEKLSSISERFQDSAPLSAVLAKVNAATS